MQYTADGRDLLGAFTRATFCTVVSRSPEKEVVRPQAAHPVRAAQPQDRPDALNCTAHTVGPSQPCWGSQDISPFCRRKKWTQSNQALSKATDRGNGRVGTYLVPGSLCYSLDCFKSPYSSPEETLGLQG